MTLKVLPLKKSISHKSGRWSSTVPFDSAKRGWPRASWLHHFMSSTRWSFLQAYRFRWNASLIPLTDFFFLEDFSFGESYGIDIDWRMLGVMIWCKKAGQNFGILLRRLAWGIMWGGERLHLESDLGAMTRFDKVSQANFNFSNLRLFMTFPKPQKSFTNFHPHTGISDTWFFAPVTPSEKHGAEKTSENRLCLKHATASWPPPMPDAGKAGWCSW